MNKHFIRTRKISQKYHTSQGSISCPLSVRGNEKKRGKFNQAFSLVRICIESRKNRHYFHRFISEFGGGRCYNLRNDKKVSENTEENPAGYAGECKQNKGN